MKPKDKERLIKMRPTLVQMIDVATFLSSLERERALTVQEVDEIMSIKARRSRVERFLDIIEHKSSEVYQVFLEILEETYPHVYLTLTDKGKLFILLQTKVNLAYIINLLLKTKVDQTYTCKQRFRVQL